MHPAYSVILFTTASGAGYGLLVWLAVFGALGLAPITPEFGLTGFVLALGLISTGLLSSTFHLGRPERAWRAVTQWRSSWLSREGIMALVTYLPAAALAIGWVFFKDVGGPYVLAAILTVVGALLTVWCTGMIYASLRTINAWHQPLVAPLYLILGLGTGAVLFDLLLCIWGAASHLLAALAVVLLATSLGLKRVYWRAIDQGGTPYSTGMATGLGQFGKVRPLEPPHTQPNYVMREMGYRVARKHALKLRRFVIVLAFAVPIVALLLSLVFSAPVSLIASTIAVLSSATGIVVERWLFFAEATHVVTLFYGKQ